MARRDDNSMIGSMSNLREELSISDNGRFWGSITPLWGIAHSQTLVPLAYGFAPDELMAYVWAIGGTIEG